MLRKKSLVWHRLDLRTADNPALWAATQDGSEAIPVFIWAPTEESPWAPGSASRWWLHHSLQRLAEDYKRLGVHLIIRQGPSLETLQSLVRESGADAVYWNRRYEPGVISRDAIIKDRLKSDGITAESFNGSLLWEPWEIRNQAGGPFQVFTPFWRHCLSKNPPLPPSPVPQLVRSSPGGPKSESIASLGLLPSIRWDVGMEAAWTPGEAGAAANLGVFLENAFLRYGEERNRPDRVGTSRLSPHLHFGEITPRQIWHALKNAGETLGWPETQWRQSQFLAEVGWREFAFHLLYHFPNCPERPLRKEWDNFEWPPLNQAHWEAWKRGRTGFPIVDAGMRELWATGWMHNRVRMIVASFLIKDLMISWTEGARWFWDTLVDADLAANTLGWQWTAGCGADAAPYFRVFNPESQGEKFDPRGEYVRRWIPELRHLPAESIHSPTMRKNEIFTPTAPNAKTAYPDPIVDHALARNRALAAYTRLRNPAGV
jgi:deoxyribodipyrimidine photo-lyase